MLLIDFQARENEWADAIKTSINVVCIGGLWGNILGLMAPLPQFLCLNFFLLYINLGDKVWWGTSGNNLSLYLDFIIFFSCNLKF